MNNTSVNALVQVFLELTEEKFVNFSLLPFTDRRPFKMTSFEVEGLEVELDIRGDATVIGAVPSTEYINRVATLKIFGPRESEKISLLFRPEPYISIGAVEFPKNPKKPDAERASEFKVSLKNTLVSPLEIPSRKWLPACILIIQRMHVLSEYFAREPHPIAVPAPT